MAESMPGGGAAQADAKRDLLARLLAEEGLAGRSTTIPRRVSGVDAPLSYAQEVVWLLDRATPGLIAYNSAAAVRLRGPLDIDALDRAIRLLVARHDALRTRMTVVGDRPVQRVDETAAVELAVEDLRALAAANREPEAARRLRAIARQPFDLERDHLFRPVLVRLDDTQAILLLLTHHIVSDAWSYGVILDELSVLYAAAHGEREHELAAPPIRFADFATWERAELAGERLATRLAYWRDSLLPAAPDLAVPTDRPRPAAPAFGGGRAFLSLPRPLLDQLKTLAAREGATLYMVLLAAFQSVLHRWSGQDDLVTGSAIAGRTRRETERVVGYFSAALPLRTRFIDGEGFRALLARVRTTVLGVLEHADVPSEALVHELQAQGRPGHTPLFQTVLTMQENQGGVLDIEGVISEPYEIESGTTKFELTLLPSERPSGLDLLLWYRTDLFDAGTADRLLAHVAAMLRAVAADPDVAVDNVPLLSDAERVELAGWNATATDAGPPTTMAAMIQNAATRRGPAPAIVAGEQLLTWAEFAAQGHRLAHHLQALGVGPDVPVGLCLDRSADLIVAMYGILASGGAYVPLLPDQPAPRLAQQLRESNATVVVTTSAFRSLLPTDRTVVQLDLDADALRAFPATPPANAAGPDSLAYVLFTSGSTGTPKGVSVSHANLVNYVRGIAATLGVDLATQEPPSCATVSTLAADLGHTSVFTALAWGGRLHVLPNDVVVDAARFQAYMESHAVDLLKITPSHLQALAGPDVRAATLPRQWLVLGGEACPWSLVERVRAAAPGCRVLNHYGPTETTVGACTFEVGARDVSMWQPASVPIGRPLPNVTAHVLDRWQQEVPIGVPGELWIGGVGVARGYLHRDDLTRERFVTVGGGRLYRTGDRARRLPTGDLEFQGRLDQQVKVRGYRVELGEIESVLVRHPSVRQAAVVLRDDQLVGYVVINSSMPIDDAAIVTHVAADLPSYMIPDVLVRLHAIPLNANGKVDRAALPEPAAPVSDALDGSPRTETERQLAALWADVLKRETIGIHENFFALGGHSLLAIRLLGRIAKIFGRRLALRALFEHPTIAGLAAVLDDTEAAL